MRAQNAPTQSIEAGGVRYAYRRFGMATGVPLVLLQHYRGNLDNWDPMLLDGLAGQREVIPVDYPGVGASTGEPDHTVADTAKHMIAFIDALGLTQIDLLGYSIGGFVAQDIALARTLMIRRLVLAGTGPRGGPGMHGWRQDIADHARNPEISGAGLLYVFFAHTDTSQAKGKEYLGRFLARSEDRDLQTDLAVRDAQYDAVEEWGIPDHAALQRLTGIQCPTLILQGDDDLMIPTKASHLMAGLIPDARIVIYPDAAHGSIFQYPNEVAAEVNGFLG